MVNIISSIPEIPKTGKVVIDFFADWCGPCRKIAPIYTQYSEQYSEITFLKVNVDDADGVAEAFDVEALPTFLFLNNGIVVTKFSGGDSEILKEECEKLNSASSSDLEKDNVDLEKQNVDLEKQNVDLEKQNVDLEKENVDLEKENLDLDLEKQNKENINPSE